MFAGLLFTAGAIGDRFGRKGALQLGLLGFLVGAALASASTEMWQLIACRALMGACAAFIMPSTLSILVNVFRPEERAKAIAIWAGVTGGAGVDRPGRERLAARPLLVRIGLPRQRPDHLRRARARRVPRPEVERIPKKRKLDLVGAGLSIVGISSLVYGLIEAPDKGWTSTSTLTAFVVSAVVLTVFVLWEKRVAEPMLDMPYFRNPAFSTATGGMVLVFLSMFGVMFLITQYFQLVLGYSPLSAALRFLPMAPIMMIVSPLTPRIVARLGANRTVALGMGLVSIGFLSFSFIGVDTPYLYVLMCVLFLVTGIALTMSPMTAAIMSAVPPRRAGAGSAMNDATRELGAALGVAVLGSIAASRYGSGISGRDRAPRAGGPGRGAHVARRVRCRRRRICRVTSPAQVNVRGRARVRRRHPRRRVRRRLSRRVRGAARVALPSRQIEQHGALEGPVAAAEDIAELALAGVPPVFADTAAGT